MDRHGITGGEPLDAFGGHDECTLLYHMRHSTCRTVSWYLSTIAKLCRYTAKTTQYAFTSSLEALTPFGLC